MVHVGIFSVEILGAVLSTRNINDLAIIKYVSICVSSHEFCIRIIIVSEKLFILISPSILIYLYLSSEATNLWLLTGGPSADPLLFPHNAIAIPSGSEPSIGFSAPEIISP